MCVIFCTKTLQNFTLRSSVPVKLLAANWLFSKLKFFVLFFKGYTKTYDGIATERSASCSRLKFHLRSLVELDSRGKSVASLYVKQKHQPSQVHSSRRTLPEHSDVIKKS